MSPFFSERTFEFCFNAEFCQTFGGLLASHPHIPSQQMEKDLGYDVEFQIQQSQFTTSIFVQHKVAHFAECRAGKNMHFYAAHGGPYFRFAVDNHQHNTLCELSRTNGNAYYCAPRFHRRQELEGHFRAGTIGDSVLLLDPLQVGPIGDRQRHNVTYAPDGSAPQLHSETREFKSAYTGGRESPPEFKHSRVTLDYVGDLSDWLMQWNRTSRRRHVVERETRGLRPVERVQWLLGRAYQVSWILLP